MLFRDNIGHHHSSSLLISCTGTGIAFATLLLATGCSGSGSSSGSPTVENFQGATMVIGQDTFSKRYPNKGTLSVPNPGPSQGSFHEPRGNPVFSRSEDANRVLYLPDDGNFRLQYYIGGIPDSLGAQPEGVLGTTGNNFEEFSQGSGTSTNFGGVFTVTASDNVLFVADPGQERISAFEPIPGVTTYLDSGSSTLPYPPAEFVVGQEETSDQGAGCAANRMDRPSGVIYVSREEEPGMLLVADTHNHRILIFDPAPTDNNADADLVLGQENMTSCDPNRNNLFDAPFGGNLNEPYEVWSDGERIVVADRGNHRVLVWESFPEENGEPADFALGQPLLSTHAPNRDFGAPENNADADTLWDPRGVYSDGERLFVADSLNHRVLVWETFPIGNGDPADAVLGQRNFQNNTANDLFQTGETQTLGTSKRALWLPTGVYFHEDQLLVTDTGNNRYLVFDLD